MDAIYEDIIQLEPLQLEYWTCPYQITDDARMKMGFFNVFIDDIITEDIELEC